MAYYYGFNRGDAVFNVAIQSSTTGKEVELVVNQSAITDRQTLKLALERLIDAVVQAPWPPL